MELRIESGKFKQKKITLPNLTGVRPTKSIVKSGFFNSMMQHIEEASFLDICCGTGNIGIEALSRGADSATFIDNDSQVIQLLRKTITSFNIKKDTTVIKGSLFNIDLGKLLSSHTLIYVDPPYPKSIESLIIIFDTIDKPLLPNAILCIEIPSQYKKETLSHVWENLFVTKSKEYGKTLLVYLSS